jgi:hypothetical protein
VCGNDCGGGGCLELSIYVSVWTEDGGGRRTEEEEENAFP